MSTVYLVCWYEYYKGYSEPKAAFFNKDAAEAMAQELTETEYRGGGRYRVLQVEIKDSH